MHTYIFFRHFHLAQGCAGRDRLRGPLPGGVVHVRPTGHDRCALLRRAGNLHPQVLQRLRLTTSGRPMGHSRPSSTCGRQTSSLCELMFLGEEEEEKVMHTCTTTKMLVLQLDILFLSQPHYERDHGPYGGQLSAAANLPTVRYPGHGPQADHCPLHRLPDLAQLSGA